MLTKKYCKLLGGLKIYFTIIAVLVAFFLAFKKILFHLDTGS